MAEGSDVNQEGESESNHVVYEGQHYVLENKNFSVVCTLIQFDQLKWTHRGKTVVPGEGG